MKKIGGDEVEGGGGGIFRAATTRFDHAMAAQGAAQGGAGPRKAAQLRPAAARDRMRRRDTVSTGNGGRVQPAAVRRGFDSKNGSRASNRRRRRVASAADLALACAATTVRRRLTKEERCGDGATAVRRRSPAVVAGWRCKMGLEMKWVWRGENGFGGR
ncbi:hypothetical protein Syun_015193 [Stephania yunnanensis]|uniref:Uncharacterized protein n=1 Tax=Stephania yunnanensis TaxID=152371 RepID=A0AAP0P958_9MAGN